MHLVIDVENTVTDRGGKMHLDPYEPTNTLTMVGLGNADTEGKPHVFTFDHAEVPSQDATKLKSILKQAKLVIMHNAQHDLQWLWACGFEFDCDIYDTMLAEYILCRGMKKRISLQECAERYDLAYSKQDTLKEYFKKGYTTRDIPHAELSEYLRADINVTRALYKALRTRYQDKENESLHTVLDVANKVCKTLTRIYMNGMKVDSDELESVKQEFEREKKQIEDTLQVQVREFMGDTPINLNSPEQLSQLIYSRRVRDKKVWGEELFKFTNDRTTFRGCVEANTKIVYKTKARQCDECRGEKKVFKIRKDGTLFKKANICKRCIGNGYLLESTGVVGGLQFNPLGKSWVSANGFSTAKGHLDSLENLAVSRNRMQQSKFIANVKRLSALDSYLSSFVQGIETFKKPDSILHVGLTQTVTSTGRFSGRNPNMQNMPRGSTFPVKRVFVSRWENGQILEADFAQLEFRVAAYLSQDKVAMEEVKTGFDVHSYTAKIISDAGQPTSRQVAKMHTFAPLYGASGYGRTKAEAEYYRHFNKKYVGIAEWHQQLANEAIATKKIVIPSGRQYSFPQVERRTHGQGVTFFTMIKNYPVQGFATGCIVPIILLEFEKALDKMNSCLVNTVHDSIVVDVHPNEVDKVIAAVAYLNKNLHDIIHQYYAIDFNVPLLLDAKIGKNWLDTREI
jgi:DNA polymerase I-like protein with 3'-5' exonuclease and polymerase domains